ncbi:leucine-rich repeat protein SHOC-2-like [Octopus sinensis]|uniref:Leucine-rich repeat protein SHOC-2-like n=1 Tax=Octopus sinensis TaxID=2607531 RepID=A0A7E6EHN5_9MOLL|nr:leucine-rich repeat protein SHOC-2-like [Octopus sinensis]
MTFSLTAQIVWLVCSISELSTLPIELSKCSKVKVLNCDTNPLFGLVNLNTLLLAHNQLDSIPPTVGLLRKLRILTVDDNELTSLPDEMTWLSHLAVLSVSNNKLTSLPDDFSNMPSLRVLQLSGNLLSCIPLSIFKLSVIPSIYVSTAQRGNIPVLEVENDTMICQYFPQEGRPSTPVPRIVHVSHSNKLAIRSLMSVSTKSVCLVCEWRNDTGISTHSSSECSMWTDQPADPPQSTHRRLCVPTVVDTGEGAEE